MQRQAILRDSLSLQEPRDWKQLVIEALVQAFPGEAWVHGPLREQWLPHALQVATWIRAERTLRMQGQSQDALPLARRARTIFLGIIEAA
ncbi:hypothetical protein [Thermogemmatispora tikiterensis]|uniref:Uncharacterized protein n=1 Tax=Thermogemmatispora tikiterensis TaxID=1825093 RepID=A0A328VGE9_9CHLR|nr:hypothetical protein [Thermogemmatispora tikiterensis]RAQ95921.1 hypothetical protein A4R35_10275 [Thermogemmatispora tikiterensis]